MCIRHIDFEPFAFCVNSDGLPELVNDYQRQSSVKKKEKVFDYREVSEDKHREALNLVFSASDNLAYGVLIERLRSCYSSLGFELGNSKAKQLKQFMCNKRMVIQGNDKRYRYNSDFHY
jgi:hypothetical protein